MNFNLFSKNNIGVVVSLLLVILLSQAKVFNFLLDTVLGRSFLVFAVLILAYVNKILGVVAVLFIIILFNQSDIGYLEGFSSSSTTSTDANANKEARVAEREQIRQNVKANLEAKAATTTTPATTTTTPPATTTTTPPATTTTPPATTTPASSLANPGNSESTVKTAINSAAAEGFDIIGTENNIKRGKQSNKIPVSNHMREAMNVSAFDGSFTDNYSAF